MVVLEEKGVSMDEGVKTRLEAKVDAIEENLARMEDIIDIIKAWCVGMKFTLEKEL